MALRAEILHLTGLQWCQSAARAERVVRVEAVLVLEAQAALDVPVHGLVGPVTWGALVKDVLVSEGDSGEAVRCVKRRWVSAL